MKSDFTEQASMGITEKESLEGKALQAFQEKKLFQLGYLQG